MSAEYFAGARNFAQCLREELGLLEAHLDTEEIHLLKAHLDATAQNTPNDAFLVEEEDMGILAVTQMALKITRARVAQERAAKKLVEQERTALRAALRKEQDWSKTLVEQNALRERRLDDKIATLQTAVEAKDNELCDTREDVAVACRAGGTTHGARIDPFPDLISLRFQLLEDKLLEAQALIATRDVALERCGEDNAALALKLSQAQARLDGREFELQHRIEQNKLNADMLNAAHTDLLAKRAEAHQQELVRAHAALAQARAQIGARDKSLAVTRLQLQAAQRDAAGAYSGVAKLRARSKIVGEGQRVVRVRVRAAYGALESAHGELKARHAELQDAHGEAQKTCGELRERVGVLEAAGVENASTMAKLQVKYDRVKAWRQGLKERLTQMTSEKENGVAASAGGYGDKRKAAEAEIEKENSDGGEKRKKRAA